MRSNNLSQATGTIPIRWEGNKVGYSKLIWLESMKTFLRDPVQYLSLYNCFNFISCTWIMVYAAKRDFCKPLIPLAPSCGAGLCIRDFQVTVWKIFWPYVLCPIWQCYNQLSYAHFELMLSRWILGSFSFTVVNTLF